MATVLFRARIGQKVTGRWSQSKCIIEYSISEQIASDVTTDPRN